MIYPQISDENVSSNRHQLGTVSFGFITAHWSDAMVLTPVFRP
jgi:hypothetical protein